MPGLVQPVPDKRGRFDSPFFRSKFRVPTAPLHFVHRPRLIALLDDLASYPVTAVVAPAGAGKTALAADWVRHCHRPTAWLTLDESDRDPVQFCVALNSVVEQLAPGVADRARATVTGTGTAGLVDAIRVLTDDLDMAGGDDAVLVLDDVHRVDDGELTRAALVAFVEHKPDWLHLLLLSRRRPALAVDRLRAAGILADIGFDVLRFSEPEDLEMLAGLWPDAAHQDLRAVAMWSGGWAAAIQLAALAVRSRRTAHVAEEQRTGQVGSDRLVDSYLWHEVLKAEPAELVELLLSTAVVERMNYGLAEALTGRSDAGDLLLEAEERGLFVTGFDSGGWFEVHSLVRGVLLAELARRSPERLREQHARAARWFESMADGISAIDHWLEAGEPAEALRLLSAISMSSFDSGGTAAIDRIIQRIPPEVTGANAASLVQTAWCHRLVDRTGFLDALATAESAITGWGGHEETGGLDILRALAAWLAGDWQACIDHALGSLEQLGSGALGDPIGRFGWSLVSHGIALQERWNDNGRTGEVATATVADRADRRLAQEGARAVGLSLAGHPLESLRVIAGVRHLAEAAEMRTLCTELDIAEAMAARELGDRDPAEHALEQLAARSAYPCTYVRVLALLELVQVRLFDGDVAAAGSLFREAEKMVGRELNGPGGRGWLARVGVLVSLSEKNLAAAEQWSRQIDDAFWRPICEARGYLASGRHQDAAEAIRRAEPRCVRHEVVRRLLLARAVADVDHQTAAKSVEIAVDRAAEHGMLQTVAADGGPVLELVELAAWRVPGAWMSRLRRTMTPDRACGGAAPGLVEELTSRERDVLRLLPSRLTLGEIASELFVSQNTLKFHLRGIYRKLGVNSRAEAVGAARRLRLLAPRG